VSGGRKVGERSGVEAAREEPRDRRGSTVELQVEAEAARQAVYGAKRWKASLYDEALDEQEREIPDDEGDEKPRDGGGDAGQPGDLPSSW